jgi:membrane protease YdiL (CAAX protease family)
LFTFVKAAPAFWALVMFLYPLLSVYPQELIFRAYFFERYQPLFGAGWVMVAASALAFGFMHIALGNWLSVVLSAIGGFLFAMTYHQSGSLVLACIEHAIFGNFIFTIGLGQFFYHGARLRQ